MLYHVHEIGRATLEPVRIAATVGEMVFSNTYNPWSYTWAGKAIAAGCQVFESITRHYEKPKFGLNDTIIDGRRVKVEVEIVGRKSFCQLKHFKRAEERPDDPKLLIVAPLSGHFATLLRGTVETLLPDHDIYITDWRDAREVPIFEGHFDLDDYIDYIIDYLRMLGPNTHIMAVCQPAVPVLAAVSLMAENDEPCQPSSMILMGGPIDTRKSPTVPNNLATEHSYDWFENTLIARVPPTAPGFGRRVYPGFLQLTGFVSMNLDRHMDSHFQLFNHLIEGDGDSVEKHREFYEEYNAVMDLTAEFYLQTIKTVFQDHALPKGEMMHRDRLVKPSAIKKTAVLTVEGEKDDITGPGQTQATHELCSGLPDHLHKDYVQPGVGHYGVFNGRRWHNEIAPVVREFIREHDVPVMSARRTARSTTRKAAE
ncbi:MAG: polyhydroxyalkanoate depolymerase [Alphaproteobacteria bacterium]|nr:polyhydroxyalkanoate depolymerase [Alphaproteobacteria bacterium]